MFTNKKIPAFREAVNGMRGFYVAGNHTFPVLFNRNLFYAFYNVLRLLSQPTIPTPMPPSRIAPGAGIVAGVA
jgi:hypothetical protein